FLLRRSRTKAGYPRPIRKCGRSAFSSRTSLVTCHLSLLQSRFSAVSVSTFSPRFSPKPSRRLTLPLVHLFCSLIFGLPQSGVISLDRLGRRSDLTASRRKVRSLRTVIPSQEIRALARRSPPSSSVPDQLDRP